MSGIIWKFPLALMQEQSVQMPYGATVLTVQVQDAKLVVWAYVNPQNAVELRKFRVALTGEALDDYPGRHLGTVQLGVMVFHVFEQA